jgi:predicted lysophospholipase L1 biosynthesis ABC-type transport system permease subunit
VSAAAPNRVISDRPECLNSMTVLILSIAVAVIAALTVLAGVLVVRGPVQIRELERRHRLAQERPASPATRLMVTARMTAPNR